MQVPQMGGDQQRMKIAVIGSLNMDLVVRTARFPEAGETVLAHSYSTFAGGKGANQAVAAARLGARVKFLGCIGTDSYGTELVNTLNQEGIETASIHKVDCPSGIASICVADDGENTIVVASGANLSVDRDFVAKRANFCADCDVLLVQLEIPLSGVAEAFRQARHYSCKTILNAAPAVSLPTEVLRDTDVLIANESEARTLLSSMNPDNPAQLALQLRQLGPESVIVTLGASGCIYTDSQMTLRQDAFPVSPVDSTAAGDAFVGAFATGIASGKDIAACLRLASAAGALTTTRDGAIAALPHLEQLKDHC